MRAIHIPQLRRGVSCLGLGSATFNLANQEKVFAVLDAFHGLGGSFVDTAKVYTGTEAEQVIGQWMKERGNREQIVLMDKGCHPPESMTAGGISEAVGGALARVGTDYIDLFVLHRDHPNVPVEVAVDAFNNEIGSGRIRAWGISNWLLPRAAAAITCARENGLAEPAVSSPQICLAEPQEPFWADCLYATEEYLAWHAAHGITLASWSSVGQGFFREESGPENTSDPDMVRVYHSPRNFEKLSRARALASEKGVTAVQIALAYVLNLPAPIIALNGCQTPAEVASSVAAAEIELTPAELDWLALKTDQR